MNRGLAYLAIDEDDMAVTDFDEVIRLNPASASGISPSRRRPWAAGVT